MSFWLHCELPWGWDSVLYPLASPYHPEKHLVHSRLSKKCLWLVRRSDSLCGWIYLLLVLLCQMSFLSFFQETFRSYSTSLEWKTHSSTTKERTKETLIKGMKIHLLYISSVEIKEKLSSGTWHPSSSSQRLYSGQHLLTDSVHLPFPAKASEMRVAGGLVGAPNVLCVFGGISVPLVTAVA